MVNDLSSLVVKKKKKTTSEDPAAANGKTEDLGVTVKTEDHAASNGDLGAANANGKRKAEFEADADAQPESTKKARQDEVV